MLWWIFDFILDYWLQILKLKLLLILVEITKFLGLQWEKRPQNKQSGMFT